MNPLFNALGGGQMPGAIGDFQRMMQQFQQFKATFQGDPEQEVRKLIASGKISQNQLNQLQQAAQMFQSLLGSQLWLYLLRNNLAYTSKIRKEKNNEHDFGTLRF